MEHLYKIKRSNGTTQEMTYVDVCRELGFIADVHFVEITTRGTISFTLGKPDEIRSLRNAVREHGFVPSHALGNKHL